jgi:hypothetical protein
MEAVMEAVMEAAAARPRPSSAGHRHRRSDFPTHAVADVTAAARHRRHG